MTALIVVFGAVSIAMVIFGSGSDRIMGWLGFLGFGLGGAAWTVGEYWSQAAIPRQGSVMLPSGLLDRGLILPMREGKVRASVVSSTLWLLAIIGLAIFAEDLGQPSWMRFVWLGFAILLGLSLLSAVRRRGEGNYLLALTTTGILSRLPTVASFVPWPAISGAFMTEYYGQPYLALDITDRSQVKKAGGVLGDWIETRFSSGHDWTVPVAALPLGPAEILALVKSCLDDPARRSQLLTASVPGVEAKAAH